MKPETVKATDTHEDAESKGAPAAVETEVDSLRMNWRKMINDAPGGLSRTPAAALLRSAIPVAIDDSVVVISFKHTAHKNNMEKLDNQKLAEKIVSYCLGRSCQVRCIHEPEDNHLVKAAQKIGAQILDVEEK
jgi:DNA polymerase-3 subunit gamma/tau